MADFHIILLQIFFSSDCSEAFLCTSEIHDPTIYDGCLQVLASLDNQIPRDSQSTIVIFMQLLAHWDECRFPSIIIISWSFRISFETKNSHFGSRGVNLGKLQHSTSRPTPWGAKKAQPPSPIALGPLNLIARGRNLKKPQRVARRRGREAGERSKNLSRLDSCSIQSYLLS